MTREMTGYATEDLYWASEYIQGERKVFSLDLSLTTVAATMPRPNPDKVERGNRRVKEAHARSFGDYVRKNRNWVAPALLLRAPDIFTFETKEEVGGSKFGILGLPRLVRTDLKILDGQHRILGLCYAVEDIASELEEARSGVGEARRQHNAEVEQHFIGKQRELEEQRARLERERISVEIHIEDHRSKVEQMYVDIADNALGINYAIRARFDSRKVVNRALGDVLQHPLLRDRVDMERDRIAGANPNLLGAKHVADIIRVAAVGISGRVGPRKESELDELDLVRDTNSFLDLLIRAFPEMKQVSEGTLTPEQLRRKSLLGSMTMLRVLGGARYELAKKGVSDKDIEGYFSSLASTMTAPVGPDSVWVKNTAVFTEGAMAPKARQGDLTSLTRAIVGRPKWLAAA